MRAGDLPTIPPVIPPKAFKKQLDPDSREPLRELFQAVVPVVKRLGLRVFLVGGAVRSLVAGSSFSGEWDLVVFGPEEGAGKLAHALAHDGEWRRPISFPRFGTYLVLGPGGRAEFSQAQLRTRLRDLDTDPLVSDALSRDFTLNALYVELTGDDYPDAKNFTAVSVLDPTARGASDLAARQLRTPLPAKITFEDDPLRIFRAARLKAAGGYSFHPSLGKGARQAAALLPGVAPERIRDELDLILLSEKPSLGLEALGRWEAFAHIAPEIQDMVGFIQDTPWHYPDLFRHTLRVVDRCPPDILLRWAALLHDCGKPAARVPGEGGDTYYGHESMGADAAERLLGRLRCGRQRAREVAALVRLHMVHYQDQWSDRAVGRLVGRAGPRLDRLLDLVEADSSALRRRRGKLDQLGRLRERVASIRGRMPEAVSPLDGRSIMELLGIGSGELIGRAKETLASAVSEGLIPPEEDAARRFLLQWYAQVKRSSRR